MIEINVMFFSQISEICIQLCIVTFNRVIASVTFKQTAEVMS